MVMPVAVPLAVSVYARLAVPAVARKVPVPAETTGGFSCAPVSVRLIGAFAGCAATVGGAVVAVGGTLVAVGMGVFVRVGVAVAAVPVAVATAVVVVVTVTVLVAGVVVVVVVTVAVFVTGWAAAVRTSGEGVITPPPISTALTPPSIPASNP
jgi:hypothetical protein